MLWDWRKAEIYKVSRKILLFTLFLLSPTTLFAHKVHIFAYVEDGEVHIRSYSSCGRGIREGKVLVYDIEGKRLLEGITDKEGRWSFIPPKRKTLKIELLAPLGHRAVYILSLKERDHSLKTKRERGSLFVRALGGVGLIFAIFGLILFFSRKRKKDASSKD
jgi:nickel transport protein